jgi:hypothetical protein
MKWIILALCLFAASAQAQTPVISATFHYDPEADCVNALVYVVTGSGALWSQTATGIHEGVPPYYEGNLWGAVPWLPATAGTNDPCDFTFCHFITGTGDIFLQTRVGMVNGVAAALIGNFWGSYTATQPITWGHLKARQ